MDASEYNKKLRNPKWQKMRLKILERDNWHCQKCGDDETTLNVHHRWYEYGRDPWEYPEDSLVTLCELCHEQESQERENAEQRLISALRQCGFFTWDISKLADAFEKMQIVNPVSFENAHDVTDVISSSIAFAVKNPHILSGLIEWHLNEVMNGNYNKNDLGWRFEVLGLPLPQRKEE
jgi:hypothetical protein